MRRAAELARLASACVFPGFEGPVVPDWLRRRIAAGLGGVVLYAWNVESPEQVRALTASLRAEREDVVVAIDEEGGDVTRLEARTGSSYPGNAALGAVDDPVLTERVAEAMGAGLADAGVTLDLAPVADVNTNPLNPVIGIRSFGSDDGLVARHVAAFVKGMQRAGVAACAKHFPGHGDTSVDSHLELPAVEAVEPVALAPFRAAIDAGVRSIMTAHIVVRSLGDLPATTSEAILRELLREELGFEGMVLTDALEMRAISGTIGIEGGAVRAIAAGADALCLGHDLSDEAVVSVTDALVTAARDGRVRESRLAEAAGRVQALAEWTAGAKRSSTGDSSIGLKVARRALRDVGVEPLPDGPVLVVELEPEPGLAAGRLAEAPADWLCATLPSADSVRLAKGGGLDAVDLEGRQLVVIVRDLHRHTWQRDLVEALLARAPDLALIEIGLPEWRPPSVRTYLATYGAARVNVEAAAERLYSGTATRGGAVR